MWADGQRSSAFAGEARIDEAVVDENTVFAFSSISKVFTAALIARLVERNELAHHDLVIDSLPEFQLADGAASNITVKHLLTHTAGFEGPDATAGRAGQSPADYVEALAGSETTVPPGALFLYSSGGYIVLARVIERVCGRPYLEALRTELLEPAGIPVDAVNGFAASDVAVGYDVDVAANRREPTPMPPHPPAVDAAGGLWGTSSSLIDFARVFLAGGEAPSGRRVLQRATVGELMRPLVERPEGRAEQLAQGLVWRHVTWDGEALLWHTGGSAGHASKLTVVPGHNVAIAVTTNAQLGVGHQVTSRIEEWLLYHFCGVERPDAPPPEPAGLPLAAYEGLYRRHARELHVVLDDSRLALTSVPTKNADPHLRRIETGLTAVGGDLFRDDAGHYHRFVALDGSNPTHIESRGFVAKKVPVAP